MFLHTIGIQEVCFETQNNICLHTIIQENYKCKYDVTPASWILAVDWSSLTSQKEGELWRLGSSTPTLCDSDSEQRWPSRLPWG